MILRYWNTGTSDEAGGFPNVEFNPEYSVEGCVYAITETELCMLDNCMGYPKVSGNRTHVYTLSHARVRQDICTGDCGIHCVASLVQAINR